MRFARRMQPKVVYNGKNITADISEFLKSISYTDEMTGEADDLEVKLDDREGLWQSEWMPEKGNTIEVSFISEFWKTPEEEKKEFRLGVFEIDEITLSSAPSEVSIKAISVPDNTTLRGVERSRSWESITLKQIAEDVATGAGLTLFYDVEETITLERVEQTEQSDLSFLYKLCSDNGLALKLSDTQLIVFEESKYEVAETSLIFLRKMNDEEEASEGKTVVDEFGSYSFSTSIRDVYKACHVSHQSGQKKETISYTFTDTTKKVGKTLIVHEQVKTIAEAERLAKRRLREKNSTEVTASFSVVGSFDYVAGVTVDVKGFGYFDGKYIITRVSHSLSRGYSCSLELRRCLDGY